MEVGSRLVTVLVPPGILPDLVGKVVPPHHFIVCKLYRVNEVVVWNEACADCLFEAELIDNRSEEVYEGFCTLGVILPDWGG